MSAGGFRYGAWHEGPDPLAPPYDVRRALDEVGDAVLEGSSVSDALRDLLHRGTENVRGLDDMLRDVRRRRAQARERGRLDGTLEQVRSMLDKAIGQERAALFPDPSDDARFRETQLEELPADTSRAVRELADYDWRSDDARATYEQIRDLLRREMLDTQFQGMKQALENADPADMQRVKDMLADLNAMLEADARGEHTQEQFDAFMDRYGDMFGDNPQNLAELVDSLARRAAAAQRLMDSLTPEQRDELAGLMASAMEDLDLSAEMQRLTDALRARRPDLDWGGSERMRGQEPLGAGDATTALADLADLGELESALRQDYPGAQLEDVDEEAVQRALGRQAVDDLAELRRLERELEAQGFLSRQGGRVELTPKAVRQLGQAALRRVFETLAGPTRGEHDVTDAGASGELTGSSRAWQFGDEQPIDVVRTVTNAVRRTGPTRPGELKLTADDFEVVETEHRTQAAVSLLVDLSYSMVLRDTWGAAKQTALALHSIVTTRFPQDAVQLVGFSSYARELTPTELAGLDWELVQGTNLQHALLLSGRFLEQHPDAERIVLVVTDGEPTAHLQRNGQVFFDWPPSPHTVELTLAEVDMMTRRRATINVFSLDDDPRLAAFVDEVARRNGGRVFSPAPHRLGEYVVRDYLNARRGRRARSARH